MASGDAPIRYSWYKDGVKLESNAEFDYDQPTVVFKEALRTDEGEYVCKVENNVDSEESKPAMLRVYSKFEKNSAKQCVFWTIIDS